MIEIHYNVPVNLEDVNFDIHLNRTRNPLPQDIQERVDAKFNDFAEKAEAKSGKRPTKGEICVLQAYKTLPIGLEGVCRIRTFDEVLYFARSQIPQEDYLFGRVNVGFPIASWGVLASKDDKLLFVRKKGAEGAYEGSPYSAFGALVSADKDVENERVNPARLLERSVGGEVGKSVWERVSGTRYMGLNVYDENSAKVNNGYDTVWEVKLDSNMAKVLSILDENPQFEAKSKAGYVSATPLELREFAVSNPTTISGISGIFNYIGSHFGQDELVSQYMTYRQARGDKAVDLTFNRVK